MSLTVHSPYSPRPLPWRKGNLHTHTTNSDGERPPQEVVDVYRARGYDFLCLSDHDMLTDPNSVHSPDMTLIPGNEVTANGEHILHVGARSVIPPDPDRQKVLDAIGADAGFAVVPHPNWEKNFNHCPQAKLEAWHGYAGIELYNGVTRRAEGNPLATDRWDMLLSRGRRVWGFAHDDGHRPVDDAIAWNMVQSDSVHAGELMEAMLAGRFYASTGVTIRAIRAAGRTISVETDDAQRIVVVSDHGRREATSDARDIVYTVPSDTRLTYVRIECHGHGETMAWTQPFFLQRG